MSLAAMANTCQIPVLNHIRDGCRLVVVYSDAKCGYHSTRSGRPIVEVPSGRYRSVSTEASEARTMQGKVQLAGHPAGSSCAHFRPCARLPLCTSSNLVATRMVGLTYVNGGGSHAA